MDKAQKVDSSLSSEDLGALGETQNFEGTYTCGQNYRRYIIIKLIVLTDYFLQFLDSTFSTSGAFTSRKLQRQFMKGTKRGHSRGATTGRVRAIRRTKSAQVVY